MSEFEVDAEIPCKVSAPVMAKLGKALRGAAEGRRDDESFLDLVTDALKKVGLRDVGLNADWANSAWYLGTKTANQDSGGVYLLWDDYDQWSVVRRFYVDDNGEYPGMPEQIAEYGDGSNDVIAECHAFSDAELVAWATGEAAPAAEPARENPLEIIGRVEDGIPTIEQVRDGLERWHTQNTTHGGIQRRLRLLTDDDIARFVETAALALERLPSEVPRDLLVVEVGASVPQHDEPSHGLWREGLYLREGRYGATLSAPDEPDDAFVDLREVVKVKWLNDEGTKVKVERSPLLDELEAAGWRPRRLSVANTTAIIGADPPRGVMSGGQQARANPRASAHDTTSSSVQTIVFDATKFNSRDAKQWATSHGFKASKVDKEANTLHVRQEAPGSFQKGSFRTITLTDGVKAVVGRRRQ